MSTSSSDPHADVLAGRRAVLRASAGAAAAASAASWLTPGAAAAAPKSKRRKTKSAGPRPGRWTATLTPTRYQRHVLNRFTGGYSTAELRRMQRAGSVRAWFDKQLQPERIPDGKMNRLVSSFPDLYLSPGEKFSNLISERKSNYYYMADLANVTVLRRTYSQRQVLETMTDFWSNLLHVPLNGDTSWMFRADYDRTIRRHALGRFDDLLKAASLHPAMLLYLGANTSTAAAPNENQGRELLELHSVGRVSGYTEAMVKDSARILSGWTVNTGNDFTRFYDPARHATGPVRVLGFSHANAEADGRVVTDAYLRYLAHHPATARRVAHRLAVRFVSDKPSTKLINDLAAVYRKHNTAIKPVLRALIKHPEFVRSAGKKTRSPVEDVVATTRALGGVVRPRGVVMTDGGGHKANALWSLARDAGQVPFDWPTPDGFPDTGAAWSSASRMLGSFAFHYTLAQDGWWANGGHLPKPNRRMPRRRMRFDLYVDHLHRALLGTASTSVQLQAACEALGLRPDSIVDRQHPAAGSDFPRLAVTLLDSPMHMTR